MRALLINAVCGIRSTGRICTDLAKQLENEGYEVKIAYGRETVPEQYQKYAIKIGNTVDVYWHALMARLFDQRGYWSVIATKRFLKWADKYNPDLLWLHNIHDYFINVELLFDWIKSRPQMEVKWTQHDCWAFTGGCMYFTVANCYQWKNECVKCPIKHSFPYGTLLSTPRRNFRRKTQLFCNIKNMTIVSVSHWLGHHLKHSFLRSYEIEVIYNKTNSTIFKPTDSNFREKHGLENKKIILGVASFWDERKGLQDFLTLSEMLSDNMVIVLIGLSKRQIKGMPRNIIGVERTDDAIELAGIYSTADIFFNPSKEETFGMTTLEAINCGIKAVVYKNTACEEIARQYGGIVVDPDVVKAKEIMENYLK